MDQLIKLSQAIDNDPIRHQIRQAILDGDRVKLEALSDASNVAQYPAVTLRFLANSQPNTKLRIRFLETAQSQFPGDFWLNLTLGKALLNDRPEQLQKALPYLYTALALRPTSTSLRMTIGHALARLGRLDEAEIILQQGIKAHAHYAATYWALAYVNRRRGHDEEAIALNRKAIELNPQFAIAYCDLGASLRDLKHLDEAVAAHLKAIEINPKLIWAWFELGITWSSQGKTEEAVSCFREVIRLDPKFVPVYGWLGSALLSQDRFDEAADCYRGAIKVHPTNEEFYRLLGDLLFHQWELEEAIACYRQAIEIKPNKLVMFQSQLSLCLNNLSWQLATHPDVKMRDVDRAVVLAKEAVELRASVGNYWNTLGVAQYRAGEYKAAIETLEKSRALNSGGTAIDFFFLAMARWQLDDKVIARQEFDKAAQRLKDHQPIDEEMNRFYDEAAELLGTEQSLLLNQD
jgi:tetratricopeptide (TPR) repeat protein